MAALTPLDDPEIDRIWIDAAARCGFRVERGRAAYASTDGNGTILVGSRETLDGDDSLCQLVLHELCHALVQGEGSWGLVDWGLCNTDERDAVAEAACLRLQAHLATGCGLRQALCPTTPWRAYYEALPPDPLLPVAEADTEACSRAGAAASLAASRGFSPVIDGALAATAAALARRHPAGFPLGPAGETCGSCAWRYRGDEAPRSSAAGSQRRRSEMDCACAPTCQPATAGSRRSSVVAAAPAAARPTTASASRCEIRWSGSTRLWSCATDTAGACSAEGDRCAALEISEKSYRCQIYADRPRTCRDFERGGRHCLVARRRVGLSR